MQVLLFLIISDYPGFIYHSVAEGAIRNQLESGTHDSVSVENIYSLPTRCYMLGTLLYYTVHYCCSFIKHVVLW